MYIFILFLFLSTAAMAQDIPISAQPISAQDIQKVDDSTFQTVVTTSQQKNISVDAINQQCTAIDGELTKLDAKEQGLVNQYDQAETGITADRATLQWKQKECQGVSQAVGQYLKDNDKSNLNWTALNDFIQ